MFSVQRLCPVTKWWYAEYADDGVVLGRCGVCAGCPWEGLAMAAGLARARLVWAAGMRGRKSG